MRNVVFIAPFPLETTMRFARAVSAVPGVRPLGVFQELPAPEDRARFADLVVVEDALDVGQLAGAVERLVARHGPMHRIVGILEALQVQLARLRAHFGVDGPTVATAELFRDKAAMKDALRAAGIPVARHRMLHHEADAWSFLAEAGLPQVWKPPAGAGCRSTVRVNTPAELRRALHDLRPAPQNPVLAEEFLSGEEYSFETITVGGDPVFHSISRYFPGPLEVMENPHLQWVCLLPRDIAGPEYHEARRVGTAAIRAFGLPSGMTHMEWFRRPDGTVAVGEIAARPPGAQIVRLTGLAHDTDFYGAWARATIDDAFEGPLERRYAVGVAFLRGPGSGRVAALDGVEEAQRRMGHLVVEAQLPRIGAPRQDGYEGDGYAIVRHPDTAVVEQALRTLIETVRVRYA